MTAKSLVLALSVLALSANSGAQGMSATDLYRVRAMLQSAYETVKRNYYDPKFHGLDLDARYREYQEKL